MKPILLLDDQTINQIAAGEVIEDSASCIKELLENALDAGATAITLETKKGGLELISVADNGHGMDELSLDMALVRHATSKLRTARDLWHLSTLGFRGEALASMAAVSKMKITSSVGKEIAHQIEVEKGIIQTKKRCVRSQGTTMAIHSLFYNTPARAAFQKGSGAQNQKIRNVLIQFAFLHEKVAFEWIADGKKMITIAAHTSLAERIGMLLGESFITDLQPIEYSQEDYRIYGFLGKVEAHRAHRMHQYLYINGRAVQHKEISNAITSSYGTRIPERRFPPFVCHLSLPCHELDVNVHPQKKEIRLKEFAKVERFLFKAIEKFFLPHATKMPLVSSFAFSSSLPLERVFPEKRESFLFKEADSTSPLHFHIHKLWDDTALVEGETLMLVHLSRASHFLLSQEIERRFQKNEALPSQKLLFPMTYHCSFQEAELIEEELTTFATYGFHMRIFGKNSFIIESIPAHYDEEGTRIFLESFCEEKRSWTKERLRELVTIKVARKKYSLEQARAVIAALFTFAAPYYLTNGKAVTFALTKETIQKLFL